MYRWRILVVFSAALLAAGLYSDESDRDIISAEFPAPRWARAGSDRSDDVLCFPDMTGRLGANPGTKGNLSNIHPIRTTIGFCDLHDEKGGLMLAPWDWPMILSEFSSQAAPNRQSTTLSLRRRDRIRAGKTGTFHAVFGIHDGDWHQAADRYRKWFDAHAGKPQIPDWVYDSDGWVG